LESDRTSRDLGDEVQDLKGIAGKRLTYRWPSLSRSNRASTGAEARNPKDDNGHRRGKHHQLLTDDVGHPALAKHLHAVPGFMPASSRWDQFYRMLNRAFPEKG